MSRSAHAVLSKKQIAGMAISAIAMLAMAVPALTAEAPSKDEVFELTTAIQAPGGNPLVSFDISWVDPGLNKYFLADRSNNQIDVVNPTGNSITAIAHGTFAGVQADNDHSGPDGVLTVHQANAPTELWVGDSPGKVWVLNALTGADILGAGKFISVGGTTRADELCYDSQDHLIMIASPAEDPPYVTFISTAGPNAYQVVAQLKFDGKNGTVPAAGGLEQCGWSPKTGLFYQNVPVSGNASEGSGVTAVIDPRTALAGKPTVQTNFPIPIADCGLPQGMAIGPSNQILLGCNGPSANGHRNTVIINANSGAVLAVFPDLGGDDEVWFNDGDGHYFIPSCNTACRQGTGPELLGVIDSTGFRLDQSVVLATSLGAGTARRTHSVAADPHTNQVYVPIPASGSGGNAAICGQAPTKVGSPSASTGCIAVFATTNEDHNRFTSERAPDDHQQ
jgi:hypothetical protein